MALDDVDGFKRAIQAIDALDFDSQAARANAERFSVVAFQRRIAEFVERIAHEV